MTAVVVRRPVAAGTFYPGDPAELASAVDGLLGPAVASRTALPGEPLALVVPHAGYVYSGPVAASGYAALPAAPGPVALFGPSHFVALDGAAVSAADGWATPLGVVEVDGRLREVAVAAGASVDDRPHRDDHAIEVQIPFLLRRLGPGLRVLPVAVGRSEPGEVAALMGRLAGAGAFLVVSTDLSHYLPHEEARRIDARTARTVLDVDPGGIGPDDACGAFALGGLVAFARDAEARFVQLDLRTSGDTAGDRRRVVGYGAFALLIG